MRIAFDSNILVYAAGGERQATDQLKIERSLDVIDRLAPQALLVAPVQAIGEAVRILAGKMGKSAEAVDKTMAGWEGLFEQPPTTFSLLSTGVDLARQHRLQHWDAVIIAVAADVRCSILLSEDMQDGFIWRGMTIINPFADPPHPLLASLLEP